MGTALAAAALGAFTIGADAPAAAHAQMPPAEVAAEVKSYEIPAGSVAAALNRLAEKNGMQMLYRSGLTRKAETRGLSGAYALDAALDKLLAGTGLTWRLAKNGRTVSIILAQNSTGTQTDAVPAGAEALPTIDVGAARPVVGGPGEGQGTNPGIEAAGSATGAGSYGGAGPAQDPYNHSYVLPDSSVGTRTDTPVMETPLNVQVVSQQVLQDQQVTSLDQALKNV
ncbi:MAG: secretin and TonB N-terminal domain-containing protein, partial [Roseiarcus sp.]